MEAQSVALSPAHAATLLYLSGHPQASDTQFERVSRLVGGDFPKILADLVAAGYVRRQPKTLGVMYEVRTSLPLPSVDELVALHGRSEPFA